MITQIADYTAAEVQEFYKIPAPVGAQDTADLQAAIAEGEREFADTFKVEASAENVEAVKFFVFAHWLRWQALRKTSAGAGAKLNFTQSQNYQDQQRSVIAYNRACVIMNRKDLKLHKIFNC